MRKIFTLAVGYVLFELMAFVLFIAAAALVGMRYSPNYEYCAQRTQLQPADCRYEQSTEAPGEEVCR